MTFLRIGKLFSVYVTLIVLLTGCVSSTEGQATPTVTKSVPETTREIRVKPWYRIYEEETDNSGSDLLVLPDSGLLVVGGMGTFGQEDAIGGAMLLWTDAAGDILRQEVYGGQGFDVGWDIAPAVDGGYILVGETTSFGDGESDGYVVRIEETGQVKWEKVFGGSMKEVFGTVVPIQNDGHFLIGNIVDPEDFITDPGVAGYGGFAGRSNLYLVKINLEGEQEWARIIKSELNTMAVDGLVSGDGSFLVLSSVIKYPQLDDDLVLSKFDQSGELLWTRTWEDGTLGGYSLAEDQEGNFIITGHSTVRSRTNPNIFLLKVDKEGNDLWFKEFGTDSLIEVGRDVVVLKDGGYAVLCYKTTSYYTFESTLSILFVSAAGESLRESEIDLPFPVKGVSFLLHPEGGFVIAGSVIDSNGRFSTVLIRTDLQGAID